MHCSQSAFLIAGLFCLASHAGAESWVDPDCTPVQGCGCALVLEHARCTGGEAQFWHELSDGAPLLISQHGQVIHAKARTPASNAFTHSAGETWTEHWDWHGGEIELRFSPAATTCAKPDQDGGCEYFDVQAEVIIRPAQHEPVTYRARGSCGC